MPNVWIQVLSLTVQYNHLLSKKEIINKPYSNSVLKHKLKTTQFHIDLITSSGCGPFREWRCQPPESVVPVPWCFASTCAAGGAWACLRPAGQSACWVAPSPAPWPASQSGWPAPSSGWELGRRDGKELVRFVSAENRIQNRDHQSKTMSCNKRTFQHVNKF